MSINQHLSQLQSYKIDVIADDVKRLHANEAHNTILPEDILTKNVISSINYYPEKHYLTVTDLAAKFYHNSSQHVIPVNGSDEGIDLCIRTFCNVGDTLLTLDPGFAMYNQYGGAYGVKIAKFSLVENDFKFNADDFLNYYQQIKPRILFISNPLAIIGQVINKNDIIKIIENCRNSIVVIDEAYIEFCAQHSVANLVEKYPHLVVLRTLSKFFGLAGIRLGFIISQHKDEIMKVKSPYNVNSISCQIGINLFENITDPIIKEKLQQTATTKKHTIEWLQNFSEVEKIYASDTNFFFVKLNCNSSDFAHKLLQDKIKIKAFNGTFAQYCRIGKYKNS